MDDFLSPASDEGGVVGRVVENAALALLDLPPTIADPLATAQATKEDEQAKAHAGRWKKRVKYFAGNMKDDAKRWAKNRRYVNGEEGEDGQGGLVRVNLIASVVNTIQPNIYAKAPEVSVQPEEQVSPGGYAQSKPFARTLELALNRFAIRGTNLKARGKEAVRASLTCTTGWVKVIYQKEVGEDPLIRNRLNDAQDNVQRIKQLLRDTAEEGVDPQYEAKMAELRQQIAGLEAQLEVTVSEGLVIDNVPTERMLILDASIKNIDEYDQASAIAHGVFMTVGSYKANVSGGKEPAKKAMKYKVQPTEDDKATDARASNGMDSDDELVLVWEIWCKDDLTVYTICDGAEEFCRPPYQPTTLGAQWYPFFPLQLWRVSGYLFARALVDQMVELQDEYNTRRTVAADHREKNRPKRVFNKASGITNAEITELNGSSSKTDVVGITADPNQPLGNQIAAFPEIPYNPAMYDATDILRDIEMVSGAQDASRGSVNKAKTATEAEIQSMGMQSRTSDQLDAIEDWLTSILEYCAQLLLLNMNEAQIKAAFGQDAVWPELSKKDLFDNVIVQIRAGSTSKPNKMRERDQWLQFLPQLQEAVMKIAELRTNGQDELADAVIQLLDETLRRFDERMSIKEFIPGLAEDDDQDPAQQKQKLMDQVKKLIQQKTQEAEQAMEQEKADLQKQREDVTKRATDLQVREIHAQADEQVFALKTQMADQQRALDIQKASADVVAVMRDLLVKHDLAVRTLLTQPDPQAGLEAARVDLQTNIDQLIGTVEQQAQEIAFGGPPPMEMPMVEQQPQEEMPPQF
jgi:hypothetical protein